jgi:hypothetical protein
VKRDGELTGGGALDGPSRYHPSASAFRWPD